MTSIKTEFPILGSKPKECIPLNVIKLHEKQAIINHAQTLEQLASRGGLSWVETLFVLKNEPYNYKTQLSEISARTKVLQIVNLQFKECVNMNNKEIKKINETIDSLNYDLQDKVGRQLMYFLVGYADNSDKDSITFECIFKFIEEKIKFYKNQS